MPFFFIGVTMISMKKKLLVLLSIPALLLTGCTFINNIAITKEVSVYDLDNKELLREYQTGNIESAKVGTLNACFIRGEKYITYLTLEQYASLYDCHLKSGLKSEVSSLGSTYTWIIHNGESLYFRSIIDTSKKTVKVEGSIDYALKQEDDPQDLTALNFGLQIDSDGQYLSSKNYELYSFKETDTRRFKYKGQTYFPLGFLDTTYSASSGMYFSYNYVGIYSTHDADAFTERGFYDANGSWTTYDFQMGENVDDLFMPSYLAEYNAKLFVYMMDNFYGLKEYYGIESMTSYFKKLGYYNNLLSNQASVREKAYSSCLNSFDDNHTALVQTNGVWGSYTPTDRGPGIIARSNLYSTLCEYRYASYEEVGKYPFEDIVYSNDGKTAMFAFDNFFFGTSEEVFNTDGTIKDTAHYYDHYISLIETLNAIKEKGTVQNVILDISTNGGGVVGVMMKLLSLLSKNNSSDIYFYNCVSTELDKYTSHVDVNFDGVYYNNETFGNDFNFFILTSDCSFSCGNAFPCYAQAQNLAKIIGQKSGGGECAVDIHFLPNTEYVYHSSNLHLGYYYNDARGFVGFEDGATPDYAIEINPDFYDINRLSALIS